MRFITPEEWNPVDKIELEGNADFVVKSNCSVIVTAGPGAGKTEMLAQRTHYLLMTNTCIQPYKILAISFKKDSAENLKKRVVSRCGEFANNRFVSLTFDSFAKRILDQFIVALPDKIRPHSNYLIFEDRNEDAWNVIRALFVKKGLGQRRDEDDWVYNRRVRETVNSFSLKNCRCLSLEEKSIFSLMLKGNCNGNSVLTYRLVKELALFILSSKTSIANVVRNTYSHVFLDEFQDTTELQYDLITACFKNTHTIMTAVGDEKQKIMTWAGALSNAFELFISDFKAISKDLVQNHRSAPRLVQLQKDMYASLNAQSQQVVYVDKWKDSDGYIALVECKDENKESEFVVASIENYIKKGIAANEISIICRNNPNRFTNSIIYQLEKKGIFSRLEADFMDLEKSPLVRVILSFLRLLVESNSDDWENVVSFAVCSKKIVENKYLNFITDLRKIIFNLKSRENSINDYKSMSVFIDCIVNFLDLDGMKQVYVEYSNGSVLTNVLRDFKLNFWNCFRKMNNSWIDAVEYFMGNKSIPIMTIHRSKGLEYKVVFLLGLEDEIFWNFRNQAEEERCNFFVAISRAKTDLIFTYCNSRNNNQRNHHQINEFHELLRTSGLAEIKKEL